jgi:hypothetical protein
MDQASQELFDTIVRKDAPSLTEHEIAVLRARESYLNAEQRERFAAVLAPTAPAAHEDEDAEEAKTSKKKKDS